MKYKVLMETEDLVYYYIPKKDLIVWTKVPVRSPLGLKRSLKDRGEI